MNNKTKVINYVNDLKGYQGYVQFSHRQIDRDKDIFIKTSPNVEDENGFIYEAHFCNNKESISIKQINNRWLVSKTDISNIANADTQEFVTDIEKFPKVKMAQIWKIEKDTLCENMEVKKLKKVVFMGFIDG